MAISAGKYTISTEQNARKGKIWNVRVYKRGLLKRLVSSDWFLDEAQAREFERRLEETLKKDANVQPVLNRKPGWTFMSSW